MADLDLDALEELMKVKCLSYITIIILLNSSKKSVLNKHKNLVVEDLEIGEVGLEKIEMAKDLGPDHAQIEKRNLISTRKIVGIEGIETKSIDEGVGLGEGVIAKGENLNQRIEKEEIRKR